MSLPYTAYGPIPHPRSLAHERQRRKLVRARLASCPSRRRRTVYFAQAGSDATGDGSITNPYQTLVKLQALLTASAGDTAYLLKGSDTWREATILTIASPNVTLGSWGGGKAIITYFTLQYASGWTATGTGNAYWHTETTAPAAVRFAGPWTDQELTLALAASAAACDSTPQTWFYDGTAHRLYVNLTPSVTFTVTINATGGTYNLTTTLAGAASGSSVNTVTLAYNATAAQIQAALAATFNAQSLAPANLYPTVTGTGPFTVTWPSVGAMTFTPSADGTNLTGGSHSVTLGTVTQSAAINPNTLSLEAVPVQTSQGITISDVDGCRVEGLILLGLAAGADQVAVSADIRNQESAVFRDLEIGYGGHHLLGMGGITGWTGGYCLISKCRLGPCTDPSGGGSSHLTCFQGSGGHEFIVDGCKLVGAGVMPSPLVPLGDTTPIIAHTGDGVTNFALYWESGVEITPHPQCARWWITLGSIPPSNGDPTQVRCFLVNRKLGTYQYPVPIQEGDLQILHPDIWTINPRLYIYIGTDNTSAGLGFISGTIINPTIYLFAEHAGVMLWTTNGVFTANAYNMTLVYDAGAFTNVYGGVAIPYNTPTGDQVSLSVQDSLIWSNGDPTSSAYETGIYSAGMQSPTSAQVQGNATYGVRASNTAGDPNAVTLESFVDLVSALPRGTMIDPDRYLPPLAPYLVSGRLDAPLIEYDRDWNDRRLQPSRFIGAAVPGADGVAELAAWEDATRVMDLAGWAETPIVTTANPVRVETVVQG